MQRQVRLATIYRHRLFQDCLRGALERDRRYKVFGCDHANPHVLDELRQCGAAVVIIDAALPESRGLQLTRSIRQQLPAVKVLAMASASARGDLLACIEAGANGCILEDAPLDDLQPAIETVLRGESWCSSRATDLLFRQIAAAAEEAQARPRIDLSALTTREREVLEMIADGCSNKQIAQELHLSLYTVKNHVHNILGKLPARSRHEVAHLARTEQLVPA